MPWNKCCSRGRKSGITVGSAFFIFESWQYIARILILSSLQISQHTLNYFKVQILDRYLQFWQLRFLKIISIYQSSVIFGFLARYHKFYFGRQSSICKWLHLRKDISRFHIISATLKIINIQFTPPFHSTQNSLFEINNIFID
jgi:hypothetical protein